MKQSLLRIKLPDGVLLYPSQFRVLVAKQIGFAPALFHRADNGQTLNRVPDVRFVGGKGWVGILFDNTAEHLLYEVMGQTVRAVQTATGRVVAAQVEELDLGAYASPYPIEYWVREMTIKTRNPKRQLARQGDDITTLVESVLLSGLARQAAATGVDLPSDDQLGLSVVEITKRQPLQLQTSYGLTSEYVLMVNAKISVFAKLTGMWFAGNLTTRGYGRLCRRLDQLAVNHVREEQSPRKVAQ